MTERSKNNIRETGGVFGGLRHVVGKYFQYGNSRRTRRMRREVTIDRSLLMTETAHDVPVNSVADAMGIAVVNRCVQLISGAVSSLPLRLLACGGDGVFAAVPEGDANNQHMLGQAADITVGSPEDNRQLYSLIRTMRLPFDQLIDEQGMKWIHVSYGPRQRRQAFAIKR